MDDNFLARWIRLKVLDWEKDPDPKHWKTINGAHVHLDGRGHYDGGAGGKFNGYKHWGPDWKKHPIVRWGKGKKAGQLMWGKGHLKPGSVFKPKSEKSRFMSFFSDKYKKISADARYQAADIINQIETEAGRTGKHQKARDLLDSDFENFRQMVGDGIFSEPIKTKKQAKEFLKSLDDDFHSLNKSEEVFKKLFTNGNDFFNRCVDNMSDDEIEKAFKYIPAIAVSAVDFSKSVDYAPDEDYRKQLALITMTKEMVNAFKPSLVSMGERMIRDFSIEDYRKNFAVPFKESVYVSNSDKKRKILPDLMSEEHEKHISEFKDNTRPDKIAGTKWMGRDMTFEEADSGHVNPRYGEKGTGDRYSANCQSCVVAFEMRCRGYNVIAEEMSGEDKYNNPINPFQDKVANRISVWAKDLVGDKVSGDACGMGLPFVTRDGKRPEVLIPSKVASANTYYKWMKKTMVPGARYQFSLKWAGYKLAHIVTAHLDENGNPVIYDPQDNVTYSTEEQIKQHFLSQAAYKRRVNLYYGSSEVLIQTPQLMRVDNLALDPYYVNKVCKPAGRD